MTPRQAARHERAPSPAGPDEAAFLAATRAADRAAVGGVVERYRAELQVHCYRMLGSLVDSEDLVKETFARAWRNRASFEGREAVRSWLYRIATNACLDALDRRTRRVMPPDVMAAADPSVVPTPPATDLPWLQPYPDRLLNLENVSRETIDLAFVAAIQHLPPRQRAALILRDVLGWSGSESAALVELNVAALNSALQRARATIRKHLPARRRDLPTAPVPDGLDPGLGVADPDVVERAVLGRYMHALERADTEAFAALLREDARMVMPALGTWFDGRDAVVTATVLGLKSLASGDLRMLVTAANRQPAMAGYFREAGAAEHTARVLNVLRIEGGQIAEITTFGPRIFAAFGLPPTL